MDSLILDHLPGDLAQAEFRTTLGITAAASATISLRRRSWRIPRRSVLLEVGTGIGYLNVVK